MACFRPCHFSSRHLALCRRDVSTHCTTWACLCMKVFTFSHPRILLTFLSLFCTHSSSQHPKPVPDLRAHKSCTRTRWGSQDSLSLSILIPLLSLSAPGYYSFFSLPLVPFTSILNYLYSLSPLSVLLWHPQYACWGSASLTSAQVASK